MQNAPKGSSSNEVPCPPSGAAREKVSWWKEHLTMWNGRSLVMRSPDILDRVGSVMQWHTDKGTLVQEAKGIPHQLPVVAC